MGEFDLRAATHLDAEALADVLHRAVHGLTQRDYSEAQRRAWSPAPMEAERMRARIIDGRQVWLATRASALLGFIELETNGHIDCCYVAPEAARQGVASALYDQLEHTARKQGIAQLVVEASDSALAFFEKNGFHAVARQAVTRAGVSLHNTRMIKDL